MHDGFGSGAGPESGIALVLGIMFAIVVAGLVTTGTLVLSSNRVRTEVNFRLHGQAAQFARAGLTEALGWFRRQTTQPVATFAPVLDTLATPPVLDTLDADIGIVREFEISGVIWGRYEVWKRWDADPDPVRLAWRQQVQVDDISAERGVAGVGNVWRVRSVGYVFRRVNGAVRFDQAPNHVLGKDIMETELRRMTLTPPGAAAICSSRGDRLTLDNRVNVQGVSAGAAWYPSATGSVIQLNSPKVTGGLAGGIYDGTVEAVFGVSETELRSLADDRVTDPNLFPVPVPSDTLQFVDVGTMSFTAARPLRGTAILYVKGNLDVQTGSTSFFSGLIYVTGTITVRDPIELNGTIIGNNTMNIRGGTDWVNFNYDAAALNALRTQIGQYRMSHAVRSLTSQE